MPTKAKALDNMEKHLTEAERAARAAAEAEVMPQRDKVDLKAPAVVNKDKKAKKYWTAILKKMEGLVLLDDLDSEMFAGYVLMLSRRDQLTAVSRALMEKASEAEDPETALEVVEKLDGLTSKLQALERNLLSYAEKLGLTPSGRVRLAQKRSQAAASESDPADDLFGD